MIYYILFMCFTTHGMYTVCSSAQFPDLKQCQYSANKIKNRINFKVDSTLWCQEVKNNHHTKGD